MESSSLEMSTVLQVVRDADATRYFTAAGAIVLLYDHLITLGDEYNYIWKASPSFGKYAFLLNRYFVPGVLIAVIHESCGFSGTPYNDTGCRNLLITISLLSVISVAAANLLVLLRVLTLWKDNKTMKLFLYGSYLVGILITFSMMVLTTQQLKTGIVWFAAGRICAPTTKSPYLPAVWSALVFEISILIAVVYNTMSSPRSARISLSKSLREDGIFFFLAVTLLRLINMVFAIAARISLMLFAVFFLWAMVTTLLNRSLFRFRRAELQERYILSTRFEAQTVLGHVRLPTEVEMTDIRGDDLVLEHHKNRPSSHNDNWSAICPEIRVSTVDLES